ncbi:MAG: hypothetical protein AB7S38_23250 [Vulcanimicrobiota bacterium]
MAAPARRPAPRPPVRSSGNRSRGPSRPPANKSRPSRPANPTPANQPARPASPAAPANPNPAPNRPAATETPSTHGQAAAAGMGSAYAGLQANHQPAQNGQPAQANQNNQNQAAGENAAANGQPNSLSLGGQNYQLGYDQQGQMNQVTGPDGVSWNRNQDGTWKGSNGETRQSMQLDDKSFSYSTKTSWGQENLTRFDRQSGQKTEWTKDRGDEQFHRDIRGGEQYLYKDGSTIDRDGAGRITGFNGTGGMLQEIDKISNMTDRTMRNLKITQMYSDLSRMMGKTIPGGGANWNTWASHASNEAGYAIRGERNPFGGRDSSTMGFHDVTKAAIARGNNQVFTEIAPEMVKFMDTVNGMGGKPDAGKFNQFLNGIGNKPVLKNAFTDYYKAKFAPDTASRRQHMLDGNIKVGMHEQMRLDPMIDMAMPDVAGTPGRVAMTQGMNINLPRESVNLGSAGDWSNFNSRMKVIANLFSSRHMDPSVFGSPFSRVESADIINGHVPTRFQ